MDLCYSSPRKLIRAPNVKQRAVVENKKEMQQAQKGKAWMRPRRRQEGTLPKHPPPTRDRKWWPSLARLHFPHSRGVGGWMGVNVGGHFESCWSQGDPANNTKPVTWSCPYLVTIREVGFVEIPVYRLRTTARLFSTRLRSFARKQ